MQAVILAAGMGNRLGSLTEDRTKCMVELHGQPLIDRTLAQLAGIGIKQIVIVVGHKADGVREHLGDSHEGVPIQYVINSDYATTNNIHSVHLAKRQLISHDSLLLESDLVYDSSILRRLAGSDAPNVAVVDRYRPWMDGTVVTIDSNLTVTRFIRKHEFEAAQQDHYYKTVNVYKLSTHYMATSYFPLLEDHIASHGLDDYYEEIFGLLAASADKRLSALKVSGDLWYEIHTIEDLRAAERIFPAT